MGLLRMFLMEHFCLCNLFRQVCSTQRNTWVLTGGQNYGVSRSVGKALSGHHYSPRHFLSSKGSTACIGIPPWGFVDNSETLQQEGTEVEPLFISLHVHQDLKRLTIQINGEFYRNFKLSRLKNVEEIG